MSRNGHEILLFYKKEGRIYLEYTVHNRGYAVRTPCSEVWPVQRRGAQRMHKAGRWLRRAVAVLLAAVLAAVLLAGGWFGLQGWQMYRRAIQTTPIQGMYQQIQQRGDFVGCGQLPPLYLQAVISVEDRRFESHPGIDLVAIGRALVTNLRTRSLAEGGSTITQQLAKNELFTQEKQLTRKAAEVFAAFALERTYTKQQILEMYVNTIYFGSGYYGIHDAAQGYFGCEPSQLADWQAVMLAGLPNAPSAYSPDKSPQLALERTRAVLRRMADHGTITLDRAAELAQQAENEYGR